MGRLASLSPAISCIRGVFLCSDAVACEIVCPHTGMFIAAFTVYSSLLVIFMHL